MLIDIPTALASHGLELAGPPASGTSTLQQRPGRLVARVETTAGPVVIKAATEANAFVAEEAAVRRLADHDLPVARIIADSPGPPAYLVLSWIAGDALSSASPAAAQRAAGELLRRVHALGPDPADLSESMFAGEATWDGWMAGWLNSVLAWWVTVDPPGKERVRQVWAWFHALAPLLATRGQDLILFDGRPEHVLIRGGQVAGLIDVAELRVGDAAMDLGVLAVSDPALLAGVLAGYQPDADERAAFARLVPFYTFLRRLSIAEFHQRFGTHDEFKQALARITSSEVPTWVH